MEKSTTVYVKLRDGAQVRVEMTHMTERLPTPHEEHRERELIADEIHEAVGLLGAGEFQPDSYFPED